MNSSVSPAQIIANKLINSGLLHSSKLESAVSIINANLPKVSNYNFTADSEFMHTCMNHHINYYFKQFVEPLAMTHHTMKNSTGRILHDKEIIDASVAVTELVNDELGGSYKTHLQKYFEDEEGLMTYLYSRIYDKLITLAKEYNDIYLSAMYKNNQINNISKM